jgi:hypothetical protein
MVNQMPPDVKRFKVSLTSLFLFSAGGCLIGCILGFLVLPMFGVHLDWLMAWRIVNAALSPILLVWVISTPLLYVLITSTPVGFSADGIYAYSTFGFRRYIRWAEISKVRKHAVLNLKVLGIYSKVDGKVTRLPLYQAHKKEFINEIRKFAPPNSPVLKFLN